MDPLDTLDLFSLISPLAWLGWLAFRPFHATMNRLLFFVFGLVLYGFFVKAIRAPLIDAQRAHLAARQELARMTGSHAEVASQGIGLDLVFYLGATLVVVCLLMLWNQRALARSPQSTDSLA